MQPTPTAEKTYDDKPYSSFLGPLAPRGPQQEVRIVAGARRPHSALLGAPDSEDALGETMESTRIIEGLRKINSNLVVPMPEHFQWYYPGKASGHTTLWLGRVGAPESKKVTTFHLGAVPEWTQIGPDGLIIARGWRAIFEKCVKAGACTYRQLENQFKVKLDLSKPSGAWCVQCLRSGKRSRSTSGANGICFIHENVKKQVAKVRALKEELTWSMQRQHSRPRGRVYSR